MTLPTRRALLLSVPRLAATMALARPALAHPAPTTPDFEAIERASGGRMGVFAIDTATGATIGWRADTRLPFCSSFKGLLAGFVLWQVDHGRLRLDQPVRYGSADLLSWAPVTRAHVGAGALPIEALCDAAVRVSDNTAANLLLRETGGPAALTAWIRGQGDPAFVQSDNEPAVNHARFGDATDTTTPQAMADSYRRLVLGEVLTAASRERLAGWLIANTTGGRRLRAGLPPSWRVGDKTGTWNEGWFSTIDVAIAWPPARGPLVIAGLVTDTPDTAGAERALAEVARQVMAWSASHPARHPL